MDNEKEEPDSSKSELLIITPEELRKFNLLGSIQSEKVNTIFNKKLKNKSEPRHNLQQNIQNSTTLSNLKSKPAKSKFSVANAVAVNSPSTSSATESSKSTQKHLNSVFLMEKQKFIKAQKIPIDKPKPSIVNKTVQSNVEPTHVTPMPTPQQKSNRMIRSMLESMKSPLENIPESLTDVKQYQDEATKQNQKDFIIISSNTPVHLSNDELKSLTSKIQTECLSTSGLNESQPEKISQNSCDAISNAAQKSNVSKEKDIKSNLEMKTELNIQNEDVTDIIKTETKGKNADVSDSGNISETKAKMEEPVEYKNEIKTSPDKSNDKYLCQDIEMKELQNGNGCTSVTDGKIQKETTINERHFAGKSFKNINIKSPCESTENINKTVYMVDNTKHSQSTNINDFNVSRSKKGLTFEPKTSQLLHPVIKTYSKIKILSHNIVKSKDNMETGHKENSSEQKKPVQPEEIIEDTDEAKKMQNLSQSTVPKKRERKQKLLANENLLENDPERDNEIKNETLNDEIEKVPKKRGRPKKIISSGEQPEIEKKRTLETLKEEFSKKRRSLRILMNIISSEEQKSIDESSSQRDNMEENMPNLDKKLETGDENLPGSSSNTETKLEHAVESNDNISVSPPENQPRKRGRPRKIISSCENEETVKNEENVPTPATNIIKEPLDVSLSGRKRKKVNYFEMENNLNKEKHVDTKQKRRRMIFGNNSVDVGEVHEDSGLTIGSTLGQDQENFSEYDLEVEYNKNRSSKYRKTGETTMMMNYIFKTAFNKMSAPESGDEDANKGTQIKEDKEGMVRCMSCDKKISNEEWNSHNRNVHYNLAWREGELAVNLGDVPTATKILQPILKQDKFLKCDKCEKKFKSVSVFLAHCDECKGVVKSNGLVTCAVCQTEMEKTKWSFHKQFKHNNLAWRVGDQPLDLDNKNVVLFILNGMYKAKKPLRCEKCGLSKKSVVGFLSHQSQCGKEIADLKVKCKLCSRRVLPVSMSMHMKWVHEPKEQVESIPKVEDFDGTQKRQAAKTAMLIIDKLSKNRDSQERNSHYVAQVDFTVEPFIAVFLQKELTKDQMIKCKFKNCEFQTDVVRVLLIHMNSCEQKPDQYLVCKKCLLICDTENEIKEHIKIAHGVNINEDEFIMDVGNEDSNDDEDSDDNGENSLHPGNKFNKQMVRRQKKMAKDPNYKVKPLFTFSFVKTTNKLFSHAFQFTFEFCQKHYSQPVLFDHLRYLKSDWTLLDEELIEKYMPSSEQSCSVARKQVTGFEVADSDYELKQFQLFEAECFEGTTTFFCGGPVHSLAWLPTPYNMNSSKQVLAVSVANDFDQKFLVNENYSESSLIQLWDFGVLQNKTQMSTPKVMFLLAIDIGPVWHMEWCPSGSYDPDCERNEGKMSRMGLLAVAGAIPDVYIYSVPFLEEEQMGLIYRVKPLMKLQLAPKAEHLNKEKFYACRVSWSKVRGHRFVAVGYTNGLVALFDLNCNTIMLKTKENGIDVIAPYKIFQAHSNHISVLCWIPLDGGNRWLLTGSFDRDINIWDFSNFSKISTTRRHIISDGTWLNNWLSCVTSADESSNNISTVQAVVNSFREYLFNRTLITYSISSIMSVSVSDWLNGVIQGSSMGEITAMFTQQLLHAESEKALKGGKCYMGFTKLINKAPSVENDEIVIEETEAELPNLAKNCTSEASLDANFGQYEPYLYKEATEKYGVLFCDMKMDHLSDFPKKVRTSNLGPSKPNMYSMQAINKIAYNPNRQASLYFAAGYQIGFVRVRYMKFLEKDPQIC